MGTSSAMSTSNQYIKYKITVTQNSQNIESNFSNVNVKVNFYRTNTGYTSYGTGTVYCRINGYLYSAKVSPSQKITENGINLFNKTLNVYHEDDGTKTLICSAWISHDVVTSSEQSCSQVLTTIPRASTISSITGNEFGSPITVNITRASSNFLHTVIYKRPDGLQVTASTDVATSCTFTPILSDINLVSKKTSSPIGIIVHTYNNGTYIGTTEKSIICYVPSDIVPTINSVTITDAYTGIANQFGCFLKGKSKLHVVVDSSGAYSSTISHYKIEINGETHTTKSFTTNAIRGSGSCITSVVDSRGRTATKTVDYTCYDYFEPYIEKFTVKRCDQYGNENDEGNCCLCTIKAYISPVNDKNTKEFAIQYRKTNETEYKSTLVTTSAYSVETDYIIYDLDIDSTYEVILQVSDYFVATRKSRNLSTAYTLVDYNASGKGISFGKVSTENVFDVNMEIYANDLIHMGRRSNAEKNVMFHNLAKTNGQTYEETGIYPHQCKMYGGSGESPIGIGWWDSSSTYRILSFNDHEQRLYYGTKGLYSPTTGGVYFNQWGNVITKDNMTEGYWSIRNVDKTVFSVNWADSKLSGYYGRIRQQKVLYSNDSGSNSTITVNDNMSNFGIIEIHYKTNDNWYGSVRGLYGTSIVLLTATPAESYTYYKSARVIIGDTTLTWGIGAETYINTSGSCGMSANTNYIKITRVFGYA